ncbi:cation:proton antiporter [Modicisalibacter xianhensis]|uniref:NhaP-type Na+/H+ or K+/H+ antiporter n=1 Tax=Modicisalibacter xianhensis TaxID=442341 RepID=A0A1I3DBQ0_9GAMM|nr:cation:proton antiporter [Halomonas xianhensis]SFH84009.1 NhaP-type Na+/H+ or K+/H+ antiporter [Halomonas xianhensis]
MDANVFVVALAVLLFGLLAGRLQGTPITMPMVFTAVGLLLGPGMLGVIHFDVENETVSLLAEAALVVVLFTDASRMDLRTVWKEHSLALRLLAIGLPLALLIGTGAGMLLLPELSLGAVALLAATLAPTDAALGQSFVNNTSVPQRIRQTLNVESGLNDGLAVPFITILLDVARHQTGGAWGYAELFVSLVGIGIGIGILVGWLGGRVLEWSASRDWATETTQRLATISLAAIAYAGAELLGGNGFVAAFTAGLAVGTSARTLLPRTTGFAEAEGQLLTLITFLLFGTIMVVDVFGDVSWRIIAYALVSLFLVRPVAVALSLVGARLSLGSVSFIGWAGPRGLASIVYTVLIAEAAGVPGAELVFVVAAWTILLSIYLHGLSAASLSERYARHTTRRHHSAPEHRETTELPVCLPARRETSR